MIVEWIEERARNMWREVSTYAGVLIGAVSAVAPQFAQFDQRIAYAGFAASLYLMAKKGKAGG